MLNLNQVVFGLEKYVLGATDSRMGIWVQGCSLACTGCSSVHTWAPGNGRQISVSNLIKLAKMQKIQPTGLTISGGEPTNQAHAVLTLVKEFREVFPSTEVILFTGLEWPEFCSAHGQFANFLDVVVAGPYDHTLAATPLSGSSNQNVKLLSPLARNLYKDWKKWPIHTQQMVATDPGKVVIVGIPDTHRMTRAAEEVRATKVTW